MRKKRGILGLLVILAILVLGIGYALTSNSLTINGTLGAKTDNNNFKIAFDNSTVPTVTCAVVADEGDAASSTYTNETIATFTVKDFSSYGDTATFEYTIKNVSTSSDLIAKLSATVTGLNNNYFTVSTDWDTDEITTTETAKLTVTVTMKKTPTSSDDVTAAAASGTVTISAETITAKSN